MDPWIQTVVSAIVAFSASSGLWAFIMKRSEKNDAKAKVLIGLAHDRILTLGRFYINRKWITPDEYENLNDYLYEPYEALGGNGSAKQVMEKVKQLEMRESGDIDEKIKG